MKFADIEKIVTDDGWFKVRVHGSHHHYKHNEKSGTVTIPKHNGDIPKFVINSVYRQAELK
ncbi:addiction module toxin, HicA family protein [Spirochaetia bacterium]|nr:addiction module toxin, HicA family protein [Spirochaetia bacterium]